MKIFDKIEFSWVINNRKLFEDNYTRFKNKIGLVDEYDNIISSNNNVQLVFPFKECILEGGQCKEDQSRNEKFYNETLAFDEIDRLLSPKVLINAKKYMENSVVNVDHISNNDNMVIKGNNLLALCSLNKSYNNKVRLIYWDVPYNTGSDSFNYNDRFTRSSWLVFIKNRVTKALPLLSNNGGVFLIQCSFHQYSYLKVLLDEIIGNYVMTFNVLVRHPERTLTGDKEFNDVIEYVLVYSKKPNFKMPKIEEQKTVDDYQIKIIELAEGKQVEFDGRKGKVFLPGEYELIKTDPDKENFKIMTVRGSIKEKVSSGRFYVKYLSPLEDKYPPKTLFKVDNIGDDMYDYRYFYLPPEGRKNGAYLQGMPTSSNVTYKPYPNFLNFTQSYNIVNSEGNVEFRNGKKPEDLIAFFMNIFTAEDDLVLDAFAGSGTTAAVALKLNRRFITIEQMDYIEDITVKRLSGVINGEENDLLPEYEYKGGGSFIYCQLARMNQKFIDEILAANNESSVIDIYNRIINCGFISYKVNPREIDINSDDFLGLSLEDQKKFLINILDKNLLYINYCDLDDQEFDIPEIDKRFSKSFYGEV